MNTAQVQWSWQGAISFIVRTAALLIIVFALLGRNAFADEVLDWNIIALQTTAAAPFNPPLESRSLAIVHAAMFDAVNSIHHEFRPYAVDLQAPGDASPNAAAAAAAHFALVQLYPAQKGNLDLVYAASLSAIPSGSAKAEGIALGEQVADRILSLRSGDGAAAAIAAPYTPGSLPGDWNPTPPKFLPALDPGWGSVRPFCIRDGSQFRPEAPPSLASPLYTRDFNEIKEIGSATSTTRTPDQTNLARFWTATGPQIWNEAAQRVSTAKHLTIFENARAFALLNLAGADALIVAWDSKFTYNQWRPVTAIRSAASNNNPETISDPGWTPLLVTPPFPDYIAGHPTYGGAAEEVMEYLFGNNPNVQMNLTSPGAPGVVETYTTFDAVEEDVVEARVVGGIHWRTSCVRGRRVGEKVGDFVTHHFLQSTRDEHKDD